MMMFSTNHAMIAGSAWLKKILGAAVAALDARAQQWTAECTAALRSKGTPLSALATAGEAKSSAIEDARIVTTALMLKADEDGCTSKQPLANATPMDLRGEGVGVRA